MNEKDKKIFGPAKSRSDCPFCYENIKSEIIERLNSVCAIQDMYPVTTAHTLIVPLKHSEDFFSLSTDERRDAEALLLLMKERILRRDSSVTGFNIGTNCGKSAGQTVFHAHIHLIPRRDGDTPNPRGGVRGVIPGKMSY
ncbi:MAG: HIT family protein [Deltaproteobacteria bacterium]|jgi:ATP adenylyltransferase